MTAKRGILQKTLWFARRTRYDFDLFELLRPCREVSHKERYKSGRYRSEKCGRDIQYESALELAFIRQLEADPHVVFYWDQPVRIPYRRGRRRLHYTPDFGICLDSGCFVLAEVKDLAGMLDNRVQQKTEALMEFCAARGFGLLLTDGRHTPRDLLRGRVNRPFEKALIAALGPDALRHDACLDLMKRYGATPAQLYRTVIRHRLRFRSFPLWLRRDNPNRLFFRAFFERCPARDLFADVLAAAPGCF